MSANWSVAKATARWIAAARATARRWTSAMKRARDVIGSLVLRDGPLRAEATSMRFATNAIAAAVSACVSGLGFGQFLSYQVHDELACGDLVRVLEAHEPEPWPVHLLYPSARLMTRRLRVTIDELRDALRQIPGVGTHA